MSFDAFMTGAAAEELNRRFSSAKVEKIYQPVKDSIVLVCRHGGETQKLLLSASPSTPHIAETSMMPENPKTPPAFCLQLRRHLSGAVIRGISSLGLERAVDISFDAYDELGFLCRRSLILEIMGKCSNIVFVGEEENRRKILGILRYVDMTESKRPLMAGDSYTLPPSQNKKNPFAETQASFNTALQKAGEKRCEDFLLSSYIGLAPIVTREIAHRAGALGLLCAQVRAETLWNAFQAVLTDYKAGKTVPTAVCRLNGEPFDFTFLPVLQYGEGAKTQAFSSFSALLDFYYGEKERVASLKQRSHDIAQTLSSACSKLTKKLTVQRRELRECDDMDLYRRYGELLTSSIYLLKRKAPYADVTDYYSETLETVRVPMDERITPQQNAEKYFKKYAKLRHAKTFLAEQIAEGEAELEYLTTVEQSLSRCESEADIAEVRYELTQSGYMRKKQENPRAKPEKKPMPKPLHFVTSGGFEIWCGKNNLQNDYVSTKLAKKSDWWFHVKNSPGSHVLLVCDPFVEPEAADFTEAAELAAYYSGVSESENVAVDYTLIKNLKKPGGSKPGKVVYYSNYTAYVSPKLSVRPYKTKSREE